MLVSSSCLVGAQTFYVEWDTFITELSSALMITISLDDRALLKHILGQVFIRDLLGASV